MDITIDVGNHKLNVRAACIIKHNNKILVHRNINKDHYCLIGGRVEIGESSEDAIKREVQEELGKEIQIDCYISTVENFFKMKDSKYHEYMFIYQAEFKEEKDKLIEDTLQNMEGKDFLRYEWLDLNKIDNYTILPKVIKEILKEDKYPVHKINIDYKK